MGGVCAAALCFLYCFGLDRSGLLSADEPRYAAIARTMSQTGDWITPRLSGQPWFEKPALLYWMSGLGFEMGLGDELGPRLPIALSSLLFLAFFWWILRRMFGERASWYASVILATSAGWLAYSRIAVADVPMSAAFAAAVLLVLRPRITSRVALAAGALLGIAVLAKGLVPLVLFLPALWTLRKQLSGLVIFSAALVAVALPWYAACTWRNGNAFLVDFFWKHHFERFASDSLAHVRPFWFYIPVLLAALFPWTPLLALLPSKVLYRDPRLRLLLVSVAFGFLFFSASLNKLPGYLVPLLPLIAALLGVALDRARWAAWPLAVSAFLLWLVPAAELVLPDALKSGLSRTHVSLPWPDLLWAVPFAALCWALEWQRRRAWAVALPAAATALAALHLIFNTYPLLDREVSARFPWKQLSPSFQKDACIGQMNRSLRYGLNYYAQRDLPPCHGNPGEIQLNPGR